MNKVQEKKLTNLLGLAQRANRLTSGELAIEKFVQSGKAELILLANDVSDGTRKSYTDMAKFYQVNLICVLSKQTLGNCIGKYNRAAVALNDEGFINSILKLIDTDKEI